MRCEMCGRNTFDFGEYRWFKYDNGERFRAYCCPGCLIQHDVLTSEKNDMPTPTVKK